MFSDSKEQLVITDRESIELDKGHVSDRLATIEFDEKKQEFWAGIEKVLFESPYEIIEKVLKANGYAFNLENILAAIDSFKICVKASGSKGVDEEPFIPKIYTHGIHFKMPNKNTKGELLDKFYDEIHAYEAELARLQQFDQETDDEKAKSQDKLIQENRQLRQMNDRLAGKVDELTQALIQVKQMQAASSQAFANAEKLPVTVRTGKVKNVSIMDRSISIKTESHTFTVSMFVTDRIPNIGDSALINVIDGNVKSAYFYESEQRGYTTQTGLVLNKDESHLKIQKADRSEALLHSKTSHEQEVTATLIRGDRLLLHIFEGQIIKFEKLVNSDQELYSDLMNEEVVKNQISGIQYEKYIAKNPLTEKDDEAA